MDIVELHYNVVVIHTIPSFEGVRKGIYKENVCLLYWTIGNYTLKVVSCNS